MILRELLEAVDRRQPVVLATVISTTNSVPRRPGSKMLVYSDGRSSGSVGGGEMEARVRAEALEALAERRPRTLSYELVDPVRGDPGVCGGRAEIYLEPHMPTSTIYIVGFGHVGQAVAELARWLGYRVVAWDDRAELDDMAPDGVVRATGTIDAALSDVPIDEHTYVVMVTRNVDLDATILPPLLASPAAHIGLMGSTRRWATTRQRLVDSGVEPTLLERVESPIGKEIAAETPAEIAVSILARIIEHERTR